MDGRTRTLLIRSVILFLISVLLVAGFWFHAEFYQIGFTNLLILGGFVTFLVISAARLALSGELPRGRPKGELTFSFEEGDRLLKRAARVVVRPTEGSSMPIVGQVLRARFDAGPEFARLLVEDARRALLMDLTDEDAREAGFRGAAELRDAGADRWRWKSGDVVTLLRVRPLGVGA